MIPPSTKLAPPASTIAAISRAVAGAIALASTYTPPNGAGPGDLTGDAERRVRRAHRHDHLSAPDQVRQPAADAGQPGRRGPRGA